MLPASQPRFHQDPWSPRINPTRRVRGSSRVKGNKTLRTNPKVSVNKSNANRFCQKCCRLTLNEESILATFLTETSMHGVKYIAQKSRHWSERLFWLVAFLLGALACAYLIHDLWDRYQKTPVIITFDANEVQTSTIPFPAVTICNNNPISKRLVESLETTLKETCPSDPKHIEAEEKLGFARYMCHEPEENLTGNANESIRQGGRRLAGLIDFYINDTDPCDEMIKNCGFDGYSVPYSSIFQETVTDYGKCCSFNMPPRGYLFKRITRNTTGNGDGDTDLDDRNREMGQLIEDQYLAEPGGENRSSEWQPMKQPKAGFFNGLLFLIDPKLDDYYCPVADLEAVYLFYHSSFEMPSTEYISAMAQPGKVTAFEISPDVTKADPDIRNFPLEKRKCYFENEKQLKYHQKYTKRSCIEECEADNIAKKCGCIASYIPNLEQEHKGINICSYDYNSDDYACIVKYGNIPSRLLCPTCIPLCEETTYSHQLATHAAAMVQIYFGRERTVPRLRKALYGLVDLIANTGGILGLCLGFSVISGIELLYFVSLRAFLNKRNQASVMAKNRTSAVGSSKRPFRSRVSSLPAVDQPAEEGIVGTRW